MTEKLDMMPSHFSCSGKSPDDVIDLYIKFCDEKSAEVRARHKHELNILYGETLEESIDCFYPEQFQPETEIVVFVHGGYWQEGNNFMHHYIADVIVERGKIAVFLDTQNSPSASLEEIIKQSRRGIVAIFNKFPLATQISICGHSSGAHKTFMLLTHDWVHDDKLVDQYLCEKLGRVVLLCGIYELSHLIDTPVNDLLKMDEFEAKRNSPILLLNQFTENNKRWKNSKIFLIRTEFDAKTIHHWNEEFIKKITQKNLPNIEIKMMKNQDHFSIMKDFFDSESQLTKILVEQI